MGDKRSFINEFWCVFVAVLVERSEGVLRVGMLCNQCVCEPGSVQVLTWLTQEFVKSSNRGRSYPKSYGYLYRDSSGRTVDKTYYQVTISSYYKLIDAN